MLGALHFGVTFPGVMLTFAPSLILPLRPWPADVDYRSAFDFWNAVASTGHLLTLAGLVFFAAVLLDAFRREPDLR